MRRPLLIKIALQATAGKQVRGSEHQQLGLPMAFRVEFSCCMILEYVLSTRVIFVLNQYQQPATNREAWILALLLRLGVQLVPRVAERASRGHVIRCCPAGLLHGMKVPCLSPENASATL